MKARTQTHLISREKAIELASNHNGVTMAKARNYTDSELKEVLLHLSGGGHKLKANF